MGQHYDPRYGKSRARHAPDVIAEFDLGDLSIGARDQVAGRIVSLLKTR